MKFKFKIGKKMEMENKLLEIIRCCDLDQNSILDRTSSTLRRINSLLATTGLPIVDRCKEYLAVDLTCRLENIKLDKKKLVKLSGIAEKDYQQAIRILKNALNLKFSELPTMDVLAVRFGVTFKPAAGKVLQQFRERSVFAQATDFIDFDSSVCHAACFYVALKRHNVKVDKANLIEVAEVEKTVFDSTVRAIESVGNARTSTGVSNEPASVSADRRVDGSARTLSIEAAARAAFRQHTPLSSSGRRSAEILSEDAAAKPAITTNGVLRDPPRNSILAASFGQKVPIISRSSHCNISSTDSCTREPLKSKTQGVLPQLASAHKSTARSKENLCLSALNSSAALDSGSNEKQGLESFKNRTPAIESLNCSVETKCKVAAITCSAESAAARPTKEQKELETYLLIKQSILTRKRKAESVEDIGPCLS